MTMTRDVAVTADCNCCGQPVDWYDAGGPYETVGPDGKDWCYGCWPFGPPGGTPTDVATEDVLVAPPNAKNVTPRFAALMEIGCE